MGETEEYNFKLKIDSNLPPTSFPHCDNIECGYFIHAVAKTNRLYDDVVVKLPIIIQYGEPSDWEDLADVKAGVKGDDDGAGDEEKEEEDANLPGQVDQDGEGVEKDEADDGDNGDGDEGVGNNDQPNPEDEVADDDM